MKKPHKPRRTPADALLGQKIRIKRHQLGLSQSDLATLLGITFQQLQKYETGANRISVTRLMDIGRALKTNASYFLAELENSSTEDVPLDLDADGIKLLKYYKNISQPEIKRQLLNLAKTLAS